MTNEMRNPVLLKNSLARNLFFTVLWVSLVSIACNLGASTDVPPTLAPRTTATNAPIATIGYSTPLPQSAGVPTSAPLTTPVPTTLYTLLNQVQSDRLMEHVATLEGFYTRHVNSVDRTDGKGISAAYDYLNNKFTEIQNASNGRFTNFSPQYFTMTFNNKTTQQRNVIGVLNGVEQNGGIIIIGAHYDSRTWERADATSAAPGADDNGSGVAAVIELARVMSSLTPRATVIFALFSGEEQGRYGSKAFVEEYIIPNNIPVTLMINLDTIGNIHDRDGNINDTQLRVFANPSHAPSRWMGQMLAFIADNNATDLEAVVIDQQDRDGRWGDQDSFIEKGFPAVRIIEANEESDRREGADTKEYVEPDYLRKATRTILTLTLALATGPRPPDYRNIVVRDNGNGSRRLVWEPVQDAVGYVVALRRPGEKTFGQVFNAPGMGTAYDYDGFTASRYEGLAIAAVGQNGIMGPLSPEYRVP